MYQKFEKSPVKNFDFSYSVIVYKKCTFHRQKKEGNNDYVQYS